MTQIDRYGWLNQPLYSQALKAILVGLIVLLCTLPLQHLNNTVTQQVAQQQLTTDQFKQAWGWRQQLIGPVLVIPYTDHITSVDTLTEGSGESKVLSKDIYNDSTAVILPTLFELRADLSEHDSTKITLKTNAYKANISLSGRFDYGYLLGESDEDRSIHWNKAYLALGISDTRALLKPTAIQWNNEKLFLQPGSQLAQLPQQGVHLPLERLDAKDSVHEFKIDLVLHGSEQFLVAPVGATTTARISSSWEQASFQHSLPPIKEEHNKLGFNANWEIANLARSYPQNWRLEDKVSYDLSSVNLGVDLSEPPTTTSQLQNLLDYALWAVLISLGILFCFELINRQPVNLLQYLLLAGWQLVFFALLLSLSQQFPLKTAYWLTAISCLLVILIHSSLIFKSIFQGLLITALHSGLYYLLYLELTADSQLGLAAGIYAAALSILGLILAWQLVPERSLRPGNLPEQEENTHI